jgi:3-hydroxy-3-methylglutaryl CoA synthase
MAGIISYGLYIPYNRLPRSEIGAFWDAGAPRGEKAVVNYDEDAITLAVEAARNCLENFDKNKVDALFLATTTSPFREKQASSLIATVLDLRREIFTADFTSSLRGGTIALQSAMHMVKAKAASNVLVIASDCRRSVPGSTSELYFGDGAVAILVGESDAIATIEGSYTHYDEILDNWRTENDKFVQTWEDRYVRSQGYGLNMGEAMSKMLSKHSLSATDFNKVAAYGPNSRELSTVVRGLGFDSKSQVADSLLDLVGDTGTACAFMSLASVLEEAKAGEQILLGNYGSGADAFILKTTDKISRYSNRKTIKDYYLKFKPAFSTYGKYLRREHFVAMELGRDRPPDLSSPVVVWRDRRTTLSLIGHKCRQCGKIQYPMQRVCLRCQTKDNFDEYSFADKKATLFTFALDDLTPSPERPTVKAVIDFEGGGRLRTEMIDCDSRKVKVGMPVEMTFRKFHEALGYPNYWWKCIPLRT